MSKEAADHHKHAARHHELAAHHHHEAATHHEAGHHEKAAHHAHLAHGHHVHATGHAEHAAKALIRSRPATRPGRGQFFFGGDPCPTILKILRAPHPYLYFGTNHERHT